MRRWASGQGISVGRCVKEEKAHKFQAQLATYFRVQGRREQWADPPKTHTQLAQIATQAGLPSCSASVLCRALGELRIPHMKSERVVCEGESDVEEEGEEVGDSESSSAEEARAPFCPPVAPLEVSEPAAKRPRQVREPAPLAVREPSHPSAAPLEARDPLRPPVVQLADREPPAGRPQPAPLFQLDAHHEPIPLAEAQSLLILPLGLRLVRSDIDGNCFFTSLANALPGFTRVGLRQRFGPEGDGVWVEDVQVEEIARELNLALILFQIECSHPQGRRPLFLDTNMFEVRGNRVGRPVHMIFYMRYGQGQHFDALLPI